MHENFGLEGVEQTRKIEDMKQGQESQELVHTSTAKVE